MRINYANRPNIRQPRELRPGEFASFLICLNAISKLQDQRAQEPPRRA